MSEKPCVKRAYVYLVQLTLQQRFVVHNLRDPKVSGYFIASHSLTTLTVQYSDCIDRSLLGAVAVGQS